MRKLFLDSDVLIDLLLERPPFVDAIADIVEYALSNKIDLFVSPITVTNINYIIARIENQKKADAKTKKVLDIVKVENLGHTEVLKAINSDFKDFEDAVQNYCAEAATIK